MSKKLNKVLIALLAVALVFSFAIATLGINKAFATDVNPVQSFEMYDGAEVRTDGKDGIRFGAMIEANVDAINNYQWGMILTRAEWAKDIDFSFESADIEEYNKDGNSKNYFAVGKNTPIPDVTDFDKDGDTEEYVLACSFVGIQTHNFDRDFTVRAWYHDGTEYHYTDTVTTSNVYSVISKYVVDADPSDEPEAVEYATDVVDYVIENGGYTLAVEADALPEDGVIYKGDTISATAKLVKGEKELETGFALAFTKDDVEVDNSITYDKASGKFVYNYSGYLKLVAKIGILTDAVSEDVLTVKRKDVSVRLVPGYAASRNEFVALEDTTQVTWNDFHNNGSERKTHVDALAYGLWVKGYLTDSENPDKEELVFSEFELLGDPEWFKLGTYSDRAYLSNFDNYQTTKRNAHSTLVGTYVDKYGIEYKAELPIHGNNIGRSAYYGKDEARWTATDSLIVALQNYNWLTIEDVPMTALKTDNLIEFTIVHNDSAKKGSYENKMWNIVISEADNPSNYVMYRVGCYAAGGSAGDYVATGMKAPNWQFYYALRSGFRILANEPTHGTNATTGTQQNGWYNADNWFGVRCFKGNNEWAHDADNYRGEMFGFSIYESEFWVNAGYKNSTSWKWTNVSSSTLSKETQKSNPIFTVGSSEATTSENNVWSGFDGFNATGKKVDISILPTCFKNGANTAMMVIDKLGGQKVTKEWESKMYYSYSTTGLPKLFNDTVAE